MGESHIIKQNLEWERLRYLATLIHNVNCTKKSQTLKPQQLFPLPQDVYLKKDVPRSTPEKLKEFEDLLESMKDIPREVVF